MPKMTVEDAKTYLKTEIGYADEQIAALNATQLKKLADGFMRQQDYDAAMNEGRAELSKAQGDLEAANARLNTEIAEWGRVQAEGGQATAAMRKDLESARLDVARLTNTVTRVAADHGLDASKLLEGTAPPPPPQPPTLPQYDDQLRNINHQLGSLADALLTLPAELQQLGIEHRDLFGAPLDSRAIAAEIKTRAATRGNQKSLNPRDIWEEMYKVPDKRVAVNNAERERQIAEAREAGRQAGLSEASVPGHHSPGVQRSHSPLFGGPRDSVLKRPQPGQTVSAAVSAFRSGKYRQSAGKPTST